MCARWLGPRKAAAPAPEPPARCSAHPRGPPGGQSIAGSKKSPFCRGAGSAARRSRPYACQAPNSIYVCSLRDLRPNGHSLSKKLDLSEINCFGYRRWSTIYGGKFVVKGTCIFPINSPSAPRLAVAPRIPGGEGLEVVTFWLGSGPCLRFPPHLPGAQS